MPSSLKRSLQQIAWSSQRAAHMVNQLLAMARAEDREQALRHQDLNLVDIVMDTVRDFVPRAMDRRIDLGYEGPDAGAGARLHGHPVLLREMVRNLVDNGLQYTPARGTVTARVVVDPFGQVVVLQVEDTGPGIAEHERELVFQPFYRSADTLIDGSGLGLAIVREVARQHGATISVGEARPRSAGGASAVAAEMAMGLARWSRCAFRCARYRWRCLRRAVDRRSAEVRQSARRAVSAIQRHSAESSSCAMPLRHGGGKAGCGGLTQSRREAGLAGGIQRQCRVLGQQADVRLHGRGVAPVHGAAGRCRSSSARWTVRSPPAWRRGPGPGAAPGPALRRHRRG